MALWLSVNGMRNFGYELCSDNKFEII